MALNFGLLDQGGPSNFFEGYSQGQEKMQANAMAQQKAAQAQQEFGMRQQEFAAGQADKQRVAKAAIVAQRTASAREAILNARTPDDARAIEQAQHADEYLGPIRRQFGSLEADLADIPNEPTAFNQWKLKQALGAAKFIERMDADAQFASAMGGAPQAMPQAAPTNAMAPVGPAAPAPMANAMAAPAVSGELQNYLSQRERLTALANQTPQVAATINRLDKEIARLSPAAPTTPTSVSEYNFAVQQGYKGSLFDFKRDLANAGRAPGTTVVLPAQEKAFESGLGKGQSDRILANQVVAQDAAAILETNQIGRDLLKSGAITGTGANFLVGFNNALKQAGVDFGYADAASNSQAYAAAMGANVGRIIKQFGAGTGLSDADREYAAQIAGGKIGLTEASLRKILDINDRVANRIIDLHNKNVSGIKTNIPLTVQKPVGIAPQPAAASQIPTNVAPAAPASNITQQRQDANAAIAKGAPATAVRQRFKQNTGQEL
jgi:hypothetical protein